MASIPDLRALECYVTLDNIRITVPGGGTLAHFRREIPEHPGRYPEHNMFAPSEYGGKDRFKFGQLPAYGFYVRHAAGVTMRNVRFETEKPDERPALVFDDVNAVGIQDFQAPGSQTSPALIAFRSVNGAWISGEPVSRDAVLVEKGCFGIRVFGMK